jgi:acyl-CoA synthetase (AMP-forming)/AMP-acid ligase II
VGVSVRTRGTGGGGVERITASASEVQQRRVAGALQARGFEPGDRLGVVASSSGAMLATILGALRRGVIPVLLNPALLAHEQDALLADADCREVVRDADLAALVATEGREAELAPHPLGRPMHYTSGTTGTPKGVWSGVLDEANAAALAAEERDLWAFAAEDRHLVCSPLHHSAPVRFAGGTLLAGGEVVLPGRFDAGAFAHVIEAERPTTTFLVPAHLQRLFALDEPLDLASFRLVAHAGSACPEPLKLAALEAFPDGSVWEFYGSTEGQFTACPPEDWLAHRGTVGRARPGRTLSVDEDGTIWCGTPQHARFEYWRAPERTAAAWRGGAFSVGDLGRLDDDAFLYLDGRRNDLVITGGVNVYPAEVEAALHRLPGVQDVAVFGVDDERWGQRVCAAVVGEVTVDDVHEGARAVLAAYKCPKQVVLVAEIPRAAMGKVRRSTLAADLGLV